MSVLPFCFFVLCSWVAVALFFSGFLLSKQEILTRGSVNFPQTVTATDGSISSNLRRLRSPGARRRRNPRHALEQLQASTREEPPHGWVMAPTNAQALYVNLCKVQKGRGKDCEDATRKELDCDPRPMTPRTMRSIPRALQSSKDDGNYDVLN